MNLLIETDAGLYRLQLIKKEDTDRICLVRVDMGTPEFVPEHISARFLLFRPVCVSMGNPHCVLFVESREAMLQFPLRQEGTVIGSLRGDISGRGECGSCLGTGCRASVDAGLGTGLR